MRKLLLGVCIASSLLLTSCFSYKDVNRMAFVTAIVVDVTDDGKPNLYLEVFRPYRSESDSSGKGQRLVYHSVGEDMYEALRLVQLNSSQKVNFTQNKAIIFTKKAAEVGIDKFLDMLNRNQQFLLRQFLYFTDSDASKFLDVKLNEEAYIGLYLSDVSIIREDYAKVATTRIDKYLNERLLGNEVVIIPNVKVTETHFDNKLSFSGAAVIQKDKFKDLISIGELREYSIMMNIARKGMVDVEYQDTGNIMGFEILDSKADTDLTYDGETIRLSKKVKMKLSFGETQKPFDLDSEANRTKLKENVEKKLSEEMYILFNNWKEKGIDIFEVKRTFEREYPTTKLDVDNIMDITELELEVSIEIEGSTDVTDFVK
ncbi:MAG: hypothetical protein A2Y23_13570 [Clostridiales bacterium GWB2_37_7]|nr:MAG: hypothetical protein A2Y23_13570 [Clostridiales bacterium GWB2_37_7]